MKPGPMQRAKREAAARGIPLWLGLQRRKNGVVHGYVIRDAAWPDALYCVAPDGMVTRHNEGANHG